MPIISEAQLKQIGSYVDWFQKKVTEGLAGVLREEILHYRDPRDIAEVRAQADRLLETFNSRDRSKGTLELPDELIPIFKRMMILIRRDQVSDIEAYKERTHHPELLETLDEKLKPFDELMNQKWFRKSQPTRISPLTEYIPLQRVEELKDQFSKLEERVFDQKFRILQAPRLIIDDLRYYRRRCELRGTAVIVAFIDVDDFKENFNEKYGEITVDRRVLPLLMAKLEAHVFNHGYAYRHGGDEFVLVLPNMGFDLAVMYLDILRHDLEQLAYPGIEQRATISTGFVYVDTDCFLTDREVIEKANRAKKYAKGEKDKGGKNRIATYRGMQFDEVDLYIVKPQYPPSVTSSSQARVRASRQHSPR
jgi:diguanylate cyclase (GGDEF)-like protein